MLVFVDESGDPGFKVAKGSSALFAAVMVIFESHDAARKADQLISALRSDLGIKPEFKFSKCRDEVRDLFFEAVRNCEFLLRAIVVRKEVIYSPHLRTSKDDFYRYFVRSMIRHDRGKLQQAKVVIDGSGDKVFRQDLERYLKRHTQQGAILEVAFKRSKNDSLVQLADMCVGAIARSYRIDRKDADRWRRMLTKRIDDVWNFK